MLCYLQISGSLFEAVYHIGELETSGVSLSRVQEYCDIDTEVCTHRNMPSSRTCTRLQYSLYEIWVTLSILLLVRRRGT